MALPKTRTVLKQAGILLLAAGVAALIAAFATGGVKQGEAQNKGEIALAAALQQQPPPLWIDARSDTEYRNEHIPEALLLNEENWSELVPKVLELWDMGRTAIVYCDSPGLQSSREVAERLRDFKLGPVFVLQGGWKAWKQK